MKHSARAVTAQALVRQLSAGSYSNLLIESTIAKNRLTARDGAFASALFFGVLERKLTLDHILAHYSKKPLSALTPQVYAALLCGLYQLLYMDSVDDYAAVSESVELTRALGAASASGFVNGVLRSFLRDEKRLPAVGGGAADALSVEYSCPLWLVNELLGAYGDADTRHILAASLGRPPVYLRANTQKNTAQELCAALAREDLRGEAAAPPDGCVLLHDTADIGALEAFAAGLFHVQDRASQLCAEALGAKPGDRVLDVCAAPGGKSFTIAQFMQNEGELIARDLHEKRVGLIQKGAARLALSCIRAQCGDANVYDSALGLFDRVLCDVPCSGFGAMRRKPEIKYKKPQDIQNFPEIQYKILETSSQYLKAGGTLVYSTCTLLPQENSGVVRAFLARNPAFSLEREQTFTGADIDCDGFYYAVLRR